MRCSQHTAGGGYVVLTESFLTGFNNGQLYDAKKGAIILKMINIDDGKCVCSPAFPVASSIFRP